MEADSTKNMEKTIAQRRSTNGGGFGIPSSISTSRFQRSTAAPDNPPSLEDLLNADSVLWYNPQAPTSPTTGLLPLPGYEALQCLPTTPGSCQGYPNGVNVSSRPYQVPGSSTIGIPPLAGCEASRYLPTTPGTCQGYPNGDNVSSHPHQVPGSSTIGIPPLAGCEALQYLPTTPGTCQRYPNGENVSSRPYQVPGSSTVGIPPLAESEALQCLPTTPGSCQGYPNGVNVSSRPYQVPGSSTIRIPPLAGCEALQYLPTMSRTCQEYPNGDNVSSRPQQVPRSSTIGIPPLAGCEALQYLPTTSRTCQGYPNGDNVSSRPHQVPGSSTIGIPPLAGCEALQYLPTTTRTCQGYPNGENVSSRPYQVPGSSTIGIPPLAETEALQCLPTTPGTCQGYPNGVNVSSRPYQLPRSSTRGISAEDGYTWRKYGQKHVKGSLYPRSYFKCTYQSCTVRKKLECSGDGVVTRIVYIGKHNHEMPHPDRCRMENMLQDDGNEEAPERPSTSLDEMLLDDEEVIRGTEKTKAIYGGPSNAGSTHQRPVILELKSEVDAVDDGYRWRKYGQKVVKGNPNPRNYYKCTVPGCTVKKHIERSAQDIKMVLITYDGRHNHEIPTRRNASFNGGGGGGGSKSRSTATNAPIISNAPSSSSNIAVPAGTSNIPEPQPPTSYLGTHLSSSHHAVNPLYDNPTGHFNLPPLPFDFNHASTSHLPPLSSLIPDFQSPYPTNIQGPSLPSSTNAGLSDFGGALGMDNMAPTQQRPDAAMDPSFSQDNGNINGNRRRQPRHGQPTAVKTGRKRGRSDNRKFMHNIKS